MKIRTYFIILMLTFAAGAAALVLFTSKDNGNLQDPVAVNEVLHSIQADWDTIERHKNKTDLDYVVTDKNGSVLFKTRENLSESLNEAVIHRDTILDIEINSKMAGRLFVYNDSFQQLQVKKQRMTVFLITILLIQVIVCVGALLYLNHTIIQPFHKLKDFARRIADGNLTIPLEMDRQNLFGAFTESFDIMRSELERARLAEAEANASKKELIAKLSHDIKTPIASIKAAAEVGAALAGDKKVQDNYAQIIQKSDQINTLISNLFTAAVEELQQLPVSPADMESRELKSLLENSDYLHRGTIPEIPVCLLYADRLRLQQVFDNIFANSYKYADTRIEISIYRNNYCLAVTIGDHGGGVLTEELPLLKEKFRRGSNTEGKEGAGLGLYIASYFMNEMAGDLLIANGPDGLQVTVMIPLSGTI